MAGEVCKIVRKRESGERKDGSAVAGRGGGGRAGEDGGATVVGVVDGLKADVCA